MSDFKPVNQTITPMSADPGEEFPFLHTITVVDRVVSVDKPELVQNNIRTETVTLNLDSEWDGLSCVINIGDKPVSVLWNGKPVIIPAELMTDTGTLDVSVVGYGDDGAIRAVTKKAVAIFTVSESGYVDGEEPIPDPTSVLGQLVQAADNANQAADRFNQASEDIGDISSAASKVKGYADAAKTSETNAASNATAASQSETNAASSASSAKTSETNAAASAVSAQESVDGFGLEVGTTTTGEPGTDAAVAIQKNGTKYTANFTIPRGDVGPAGVNENVPLGSTSGVVAQATDAYPTLPRKVQVHGETSGVNTVEPEKLVFSGPNLMEYDAIAKKTNGNVSIECEKNGPIHLGVTGPTNFTGFDFNIEPIHFPAGTYTFGYGYKNVVGLQTYFTGEDSTRYFAMKSNDGLASNTFMLNSDVTLSRFYIQFATNSIVGDYVIYPMLQNGVFIEVNLPSSISLADGDTLTIDPDGTTQIIHANGEPTVLENVSLHELPAPMFNVYTTGGYIQPTVDVDYEQDVNIVLKNLKDLIDAQSALIQVNMLTD